MLWRRPPLRPRSTAHIPSIPSCRSLASASNPPGDPWTSFIEWVVQAEATPTYRREVRRRCAGSSRPRDKMAKAMQTNSKKDSTCASDHTCWMSQNHKNRQQAQQHRRHPSIPHLSERNSQSSTKIQQQDARRKMPLAFEGSTSIPASGPAARAYHCSASGAAFAQSYDPMLIDQGNIERIGIPPGDLGDVILTEEIVNDHDAGTIVEVTGSQHQNKGPKFHERRGLGKALMEYKAAIKASYGLVSQDMHHVARTVWRRYITASADVLKSLSLSDHVLVGQIPQFARVSPKERISRSRHVIDTVEKCGLEPSIVLYEILISAHMGLKGGAEQCACVMDEAKEKGLIPLRSTYAFLLRVIAADRGYQSAWSFMEALESNPEVQVLRWKGVPSTSAEPYTMDTRSLNVFIRLNAEKGDVEGMNAVLSEMAKRGLKHNSYTWAMRLYGHIRAGDIEGALRLWKEMDEQAVHKNKNVYQTMIFALLHEGSTRKRDASPEYPQARTKEVASASDEDLGAIAMSIYRDMLGAGYTAGVVLYNIFMSSYLRQGKIPKVFEIFQEMEHKDIHPDVASYTTLMSAHIATEDPPAKVDEVFSQMVENGVEPDLVAFSTAMSAHAARGDPAAVERYFEEALRNGFSPNSYTYHIRIHAACQSRDMQRAISLVTEMESHGYEISAITYNTLIGGYGLIGDVQGAEEAFDYAQRNLPLLSHPRIYNCLLHAYVVNGCRKEAHQLYDEMIRRGVYPDQVTLNILIKMETQRGHTAGAQKVFDQLRHHGYAPDVYSLVPVMRMHALRGDIGGTKTVKKLLEDTGIGGTVGINVLMEGLWKNGDKEGCEREFMLAFAPALTRSDDQYRASTAGDDETAEMIADIRTFDILVRCFRDTPDLAHHFFRLCQKPPFSITPDARLYNALIEAYARAGDKDGALEVFQEMKAQHVQGDIWTFTLLLKIGVGQNGKKAEFSDSEQETNDGRVEEGNMTNKHRKVVNGHSREGNDESVDRPIVASAGCI